MTTRQTQGSPQVASDDAGDAVVLSDHGMTDPVDEGALEAATRSRSGVWSKPIRLADERRGRVDGEVAMSPAGEATVVWLEQAERPHRNVLMQLKTRSHTADGGWGPTLILASWRTREQLSYTGFDLASDGRGGLVVAYQQYVGKAQHRRTFLLRRGARGRWTRPRAVVTSNGSASIAVDARGEVTMVLDTPPEYGEPLEALLLSREDRIESRRTLSPARQTRISEVFLSGNAAGVDAVAWLLSTGAEEGCPGPVFAVVRRPGSGWGKPFEVAASACPEGSYVSPKGRVTVTFATSLRRSLGPSLPSFSTAAAWAAAESPAPRGEDVDWAAQPNGEPAAAWSPRSREQPGGGRYAIEVALDTAGGWRSLPSLDPAGDLPEISVAGDGAVTLAWREDEDPARSTNWIEAATYSP